jgi:nitroimidazol reductase NimA-like FMN-containing flavoprotein (pyridoxamine 5'-phosphate oxidase superfamily)
VSQIRRHPERAVTDRARLDGILDAGWVGTLAVATGAAPQVVPVLYARVGDDIVMHGSTGAGTLRAATAGEVTFCVTLLDGFVYAGSLFNASANYRSAVVTGPVQPVSGPAAEAALLAMAEHLMPGRATEVRALTAKELAATFVLRLPIREGCWTAKSRTGPPGADEDDDPTVWTGVLPLRTGFGEPVAAGAAGIPLSSSVRRRLDAQA